MLPEVGSTMQGSTLPRVDVRITRMVTWAHDQQAGWFGHDHRYQVISARLVRDVHGWLPIELNITAQVSTSYCHPPSFEKIRTVILPPSRPVIKSTYSSLRGSLLLIRGLMDAWIYIYGGNKDLLWLQVHRCHIHHGSWVLIDLTLHILASEPCTFLGRPTQN